VSEQTGERANGRTGEWANRRTEEPTNGRVGCRAIAGPGGGAPSASPPAARGGQNAIGTRSVNVTSGVSRVRPAPIDRFNVVFGVNRYE